MKKRLLPFLSILFVVILLCGTIIALAAGENSQIMAGETFKGDFIAGGTSVSNDGFVQGDMIVGAQTISVKGEVEGDILGGAVNEINISGKVGGSVRVASTSVNLQSVVERNAMIFSNSIGITQNAVIMRNAYLFGNTINAVGNIRGNTIVYGTNVTLGGTYEGDVVINDMVEGSTLDLLQGTVIKGKLTYKGITEYQVPSYVKVGSYEYVKISPATYNQTAPRFDLWQLFRKIFTLAVYYLFALLIYKLFPRFFVRSGDFIGAKPVTAIGIGVATLGSLVGGLLLLILLLIITLFLFEASIFLFAGFAFTAVATVTFIFADIPVSLWLGGVFLGRKASVPARLAIGLVSIAVTKLVLDLIGNLHNLSTLAGIVLFLINAAIWIIGTGSLLRTLYEVFKSANIQAQTEENQTLPIIEQ